MRYSYATVALPTLSPLEAIVALASCGYRGVEWRVGDAPHGATSASARTFLTNNKCTLIPGRIAHREIVDRCADSDLTIVGLGPYLDVTRPEALPPMFELAGTLGASQIRLQAPRIGAEPFDYADLVAKTIEFLAVAEPLGRQYGVRFVVEMHHNTIAPSAAMVRRLVESFDPHIIGVIYDIGNLVWEGYEAPELALQVLGPYLHHVHLKNAGVFRSFEGDRISWTRSWLPLEEGLIDVPSVLTLLAERGYDGWISLEDLSTARTPLATMRHNAELLKAWPEARWSNTSG